MNGDFRFIDLFCGIGAFHQAMTRLGGECVFACDIDPQCRKTYAENYRIEPAADITAVDENDIPEHDVLCAGFPCQAFSKAGKRLGFADETKGTLFFDVCRIIGRRKPRFVILENVRNLASHDRGNTWRVIYETLTGLGYSLGREPVIFSPHYLGIPQHRERVFIVCRRNDLGGVPEFCFNTENIPECSVESVLQDDSEIWNIDRYRLKASLVELIDNWNMFIRELGTTENLSFPVWTEAFRKFGNSELEAMPVWKRNITVKNAELYARNRKFIDRWLEETRKCPKFFGAKAKLEWQAGAIDSESNIWNNIMQFRPSGLRVKPGTYFPALVAITQTSIIGWRRRFMTPRECARIQSFPDSFIMNSSDAVAYRQFGNSINVSVAELFARFMFGDESIVRRYSFMEQFPDRCEPLI